MEALFLLGATGKETLVFYTRRAHVNLSLMNFLTAITGLQDLGSAQTRDLLA